MYIYPPANLIGGTPFDISTASLVTSQSSLDGASHTYFTNDGLTMYTIDQSAIEVKAYTLSVPKDITTATLLNTLDISSETLTPRGITFKPDLSILYVASTGSPNLYQYDLSIAGDITSASFIASISALIVGSIGGIDIHNNGLQLFVADVGVGIQSFPLSVAFDITTLGSPTAPFFITNATDIIFKKDDYLKMYVMHDAPNANNADFLEFDLTIPGDITTATLQFTLDMSPFNLLMTSGFILSNGEDMYTGFGDTIYQFSMASATWKLYTP